MSERRTHYATWLCKALAAILLLTSCITAAPAQTAPAQRTRLVLKDGTYQLVLSYQVAGKVVRYRSAERDGEQEEIPLALVDLAATERWQQDHAASSTQDPRPVLSPQLAHEEEERRSLKPEVAPNLHLPDEDSVLALDAFHATPELVPLPQEGTDLNKETAHATLKTVINPAASPHRLSELAGPASDAQLHIAQPLFYVRVGEDPEGSGSGGLVVDTHGTSGRATPGGGDANSGYVLERLQVLRDARVLGSFRIALLGSGRAQPDVIELKQETLSGGHWLKLTPQQPLEPGEYALIEILSAQEINLNVWDFGIHPDAKDNYEAIRPEVPKPATLERRP